MARTPQNPQIRITEILDTAEHLFTIKGYHGTTISDIAKEMGVTQGMFYYYFKSKEEILEALLNRHVSSLILEIKDMTRSSITPSEKLGLMISIIIHGVDCKGAVLLNTIYDEQNLHIKDRISRHLKLSLTPWGLIILEEGIRKQDFNVSHPQTSLNFILIVLDFLIDALNEKLPAELLSLRLRIAEGVIEKALSAQEGTIHFSL